MYALQEHYCSLLHGRDLPPAPSSVYISVKLDVVAQIMCAIPGRMCVKFGYIRAIYVHTQKHALIDQVAQGRIIYLHGKC